VRVEEVLRDWLCVPLTVPLPHCVALWLPERLTLSVLLTLSVPLLQKLLLSVLLLQAECEALLLTLSVPVLHTVVDKDAVVDVLPDCERVPLPQALGLSVPQLLADWLEDPEFENVPLPQAEALRVLLGLWLCVMLKVRDRLPVTHCELLPLRLCVAVPQPLPLVVREADTVEVTLRDWLPVPLLQPVAEKLGEAEALWLPVAQRVALRLTVVQALPEELPVAHCEAEWDALREPVAHMLGEALGLSEVVVEEDTLSVALLHLLEEMVGEEVGLLLWLRLPLPVREPLLQ
jgi:hypothetical protein